MIIGRKKSVLSGKNIQNENQEVFIMAKKVEGYIKLQIIEKNVTIKKNEKKWVLSARLLLEEPSVCFKRTEITQITADTEPEE